MLKKQNYTNYASPATSDIIWSFPH